jgi:hypothetical protein
MLLSQVDHEAAFRRVGEISSEQLEAELHRRQEALKCFRRGDIQDPHLLEALLVAYLMLLENHDRNSSVLVHSGLFSLVEAFIHHRLADGSAENKGWPIENDLNCLVVAIFSLLSSRSMYCSVNTMAR